MPPFPRVGSLTYSMYTEKSPGWLRAVQIGLGALTIALSIFALRFPASPTYHVLGTRYSFALCWNRTNYCWHLFT